MGEGIYFPVDNVFIVDALRDENDELHEKVVEKVVEKDKTIVEKDEEIARLRRMLAGNDEGHQRKKK